MSHNNGWLGRHHTEDSKRKNRLAHLGKYHSEETRAKMSKAKIGRVHSEEAKDKMRLSKLGVERNEETKAKLRRANLGKQMSKESKLKNRLAHLGRKFTRETRAKMSKARMGIMFAARHRAKISQNMKALWNNQEYRDRVMKALIAGRHIHPNKPETLLLKLLEYEYPNEWRFVGDGSLIIGGKNPDFANINGRKELIELFGNYWHKGENPKDRIDLFRQYGYETLVVWESELKQPREVLKRVAGFMNKVED